MLWKSIRSKKMISWYELNNLPRRKEMPVGNSAYEPPTSNPAEDKAVKLTKVIEDWWDDLTADQKYTIYCYENNIEIN